MNSANALISVEHARAHVFLIFISNVNKQKYLKIYTWKFDKTWQFLILFIILKIKVNKEILKVKNDHRSRNFATQSSFS